MSEMADLEITKLCAQAMGYRPYMSRYEKDVLKAGGCPHPNQEYNPLAYDEQAMDLLKRFRLHPVPVEEGVW